jgi:hypothetical protein
MTAAEILRSAEPPVDDGMIDKAIAELDVRIWEWAEALKSAHTQLRGAFATKPPRPSARLFDDEPAVAPSLSAAAAAAHIPSPPPMPAEWTAPPSAAKSPASDSPSAWAATGGHGISSSGPASHNPAWPTESARQDAAPAGQGGAMQWPTTNTGSWPASSPPSQSSPSGGVQEWPTWTPTELSPTSGQATKTITSAPVRKGPRVKPVQEGPSPEERAQKAAAEEALLSELEDAIARRVRLLRRLDPDTPIEKLIDKAKQGQAEAAQTRQAKEDKSSSSWWRRK